MSTMQSVEERTGRVFPRRRSSGSTGSTGMNHRQGELLRAHTILSNPGALQRFVPGSAGTGATSMPQQHSGSSVGTSVGTPGSHYSPHSPGNRTANSARHMLSEMISLPFGFGGWGSRQQHGGRHRSIEFTTGGRQRESIDNASQSSGYDASMRGSIDNGPPGYPVTRGSRALHSIPYSSALRMPGGSMGMGSGGPVGFSGGVVAGPSGGAADTATTSSGGNMQHSLEGSNSSIFDKPEVVAGYALVPVLDIQSLPRGGLSLETKAVGRIQFGIPPETIKDSMRLGLGVPRVYIVPVERFCREMGPALGINLAEFEFPAYFNYFVKGKQCTLVVDSMDAENNIRRVFNETLLGPQQFRDHDMPHPNEDEDFDPRYPRETRPNFYKEFQYFRRQERTQFHDELNIEMLLEFCHFRSTGNKRSDTVTGGQVNLGVPPPPPTSVPLDMHSQTDSVCGYESLSEMRFARRHTTWLDKAELTSDLDEESLNDDVGDHGVDHFQASISNMSINLGEDVRSGLVEDDNYEEDDDVVTEENGDTFQRPTLRRVNSDVELPCLGGLNGADSTEPDNDAGWRDGARPRRRSIESLSTTVSNAAPRYDAQGRRPTTTASVTSEIEEGEDLNQSVWMYSKAKWLGEVATVYPSDASPEDIATNKCPRVEIFKMAGGTEYIVHDVDENNFIIGKARFSGSVRVPDEIAVEGFLHQGDDDDLEEGGEEKTDGDGIDGGEMRQSSFSVPPGGVPPTFHPPSFGVTVLGNSHGFDKNGSVSGYVLWINGRGVMIDPPPYSSATLEREGIRPQMIMAIIITHCHADHDAGTFQKVMTGSRVAVITTPTIYKSFIRKYAALSGLSPALLRHSHRHRPAIVGQPLKFQGATFHFTYTLHTIPCIAFKVEWRGVSMVFTGDHMNIPEKLDALESEGVLTKERAESLRQMPLQECDLLLHESGAPPIHTPLDVLMRLPEDVKKRLYVVHTSALPKDCELRVAPTGTAGTIRLDQLHTNTELSTSFRKLPVNGTSVMDHAAAEALGGKRENGVTIPKDLGLCAPLGNAVQRQDMYPIGGPQRTGTPSPLDPPLVQLRQTCVSDAWFILNLLSAVPFLGSLSYANTMEVLEIAQVEVHCAGDVVIPHHRRCNLLCVIWEGTCVERDAVDDPYDVDEDEDSEDDDEDEGYTKRYSIHSQWDESEESTCEKPRDLAVWHAGDWTGPQSLQPDSFLSADNVDGMYGLCRRDVVAISKQGVKVIKISMLDLNKILMSGSSLYRKYLASQEDRDATESHVNVMEPQSSHLIQKVRTQPMVSVVDVRQATSVRNNLLELLKYNSSLGKLTALQKRHLESLAEGPRYFEPRQLLWRVGWPVRFAFIIESGSAVFTPLPKLETLMNRRGSTGSMFILSDKKKRSRGVRKSQGANIVQDKMLNITPNSEYAKLEVGLQMRAEEMVCDPSVSKPDRTRSVWDRFANKVLGRLYARQAYTSGLVFSRGHFLSDTTRMVSGSHAFNTQEESLDMSRRTSRLYNHDRNVGPSDATGADEAEQQYHCSNVAAGPQGCVVMVFRKETLTSFLDAHPGVLLSLLGTQVVV